MIIKVIAAVTLVALITVVMVIAIDKEDKLEQKQTPSTGIQIGKIVPDFEMKTYQVLAIPTTFFLDEEGTVTYPFFQS